MPYAVVYAGEVMNAEVWEDESSALNEARCFVNQYICDFLRHNLPIKITPEEAKRFDVKVYEFGEELKLPFQIWVDEYYDDMKTQEAQDDAREYKRYLKLHEKYKDRIPE